MLSEFYTFSLHFSPNFNANCVDAVTAHTISALLLRSQCLAVNNPGPRLGEESCELEKWKRQGHARMKKNTSQPPPDSVSKRRNVLNFQSLHWPILIHFWTTGSSSQKRSSQQRIGRNISSSQEQEPEGLCPFNAYQGYWLCLNCSSPPEACVVQNGVRWRDGTWTQGCLSHRNDGLSRWK